ncbi:uncharacterized protein [Oryza sativa Japonica Group]|uniref:Os11g0613400 protein n=4 Tax=Oryza TaxID=4527 RepID=Q2R1A4_ORYSJ|nr:hypothetical protein LOC_Os11g39840 [Oryza sativa Japonica Group]EAY88530.1 hypothetical protein OsI_10003 [Oryza sativa Indica Group]EEE62496.1 hypothetical protein OsJ_17294 [Oryza sativa Japonica Group]KAF2911639.1 hypothetical protein DAI22_11g195500 [Oryza sativa Japonica Group]BAT14844.1 Os11g0613400 [Oryza sativa Japonica Group]
MAAAAARSKQLRMPQEHISWILHRREPSFDEADKAAARRELYTDDHELVRSGWFDDLLALQRGFVERRKASWARFCEMAARVRAEFEANGFVEVDDGYFDRQEENRALVWENCGREFAQMLRENKDGEFGDRDDEAVSDDEHQHEDEEEDEPHDQESESDGDL